MDHILWDFTNQCDKLGHIGWNRNLHNTLNSASFIAIAYKLVIKNIKNRPNDGPKSRIYFTVWLSCLIIVQPTNYIYDQNKLKIILVPKQWHHHILGQCKCLYNGLTIEPVVYMLIQCYMMLISWTWQ